MPFQLYCRREDGTNNIDRGPTYLPPHLSGKLPHELKRVGWYAATQVLPDTFNETYEYMYDPEVTWYTDTVTLVYTKRDKTDVERTEGIEEHLSRTVRTQRNWMLRDSDWSQLPDAPLTAEEKEDWRVYRQYLRKIRIGAKNFVWPRPPSGDTSPRS